MQEWLMNLATLPASIMPIISLQYGMATGWLLGPHHTKLNSNNEQTTLTHDDTLLGLDFCIATQPG